MRIVFFDMEELGLLGSAEFVQAHRDRPMRAMVNLDVNAFGDTLIFGPRAGANDTAVSGIARGMHRGRSQLRRVSDECRRATT